jgi:hypothetical protein
MLFFMRECVINLFAAAESKHARRNVIQRVNCEYLLKKPQQMREEKFALILGLTSKLVSEPHLQVRQKCPGENGINRSDLVLLSLLTVICK